MADNMISAYEGLENYIFISYAHKDTDKVYPIMKKLCSRGYRLWYDDGIAPGSEWSEDIALHLNDSAMVIAFVTPNSMASVNCRREINFALSKQKPFLSVVLEPTEMPLGMELQLSAQQSVLRYNYATEDMFIEKICAWPDMNRCNRLPVSTVIQGKPEKKPISSQQEDAEILRRQQIKERVLRYGNIVASVASGVGALILMAVTVLLFANYHQENLARFASFFPLPDWFADILPGIWHELPEITSDTFWNLENLPTIAWLIAAGWFLRSIGGAFERHVLAQKVLNCGALLRCTAIVGHFVLCALVENSSQRMSQWNTWLSLYFPIENLVAIGIMIVVGYEMGRVVNWIARKILSIALKVKL